MKNRLQLVAGLHYEAEDFETFEYFGDVLTGSKAILRLHMKNGTKVDLPATNDELQRLAVVLTEAFGPVVIEHLKMRGWI